MGRSEVEAAAAKMVLARLIDRRNLMDDEGKIRRHDLRGLRLNSENL